MEGAMITGPATQDAIDRIAGEFRGGRRGMLEVLRTSPHYRREDFCAHLLSAWKADDVLCATGQATQAWLTVLDAFPDVPTQRLSAS